MRMVRFLHRDLDTPMAAFRSLCRRQRFCMRTQGRALIACALLFWAEAVPTFAQDIAPAVRLVGTSGVVRIPEA